MDIEKQIEILNNICPLEKGYVSSKRLVRQNFFENIQTEIQAYLLGFLCCRWIFKQKKRNHKSKSNRNR